MKARRRGWSMRLGRPLYPELVQSTERFASRQIWYRNPQRVPIPSRDGLRQAKPASARAAIADLRRVPSLLLGQYVEYSPSSRLGPLATAQFHSVRQPVRCSRAWFVTNWPPYGARRKAVSTVARALDEYVVGLEPVRHQVVPRHRPRGFSCVQAQSAQGGKKLEPGAVARIGPGRSLSRARRPGVPRVPLLCVAQRAHLGTDRGGAFARAAGGLPVGGVRHPRITAHLQRRSWGVGRRPCQDGV